MYSVVSKFFEEENRTGYGLQAQGIVINDISSQRPLIEAMAEMFNRAELSIVHFRDAVDDWLASN